MAIGPLMLDLTSTQLTEEEQLLLLEPQVGGVIFFSRNYQNPSQLDALISAIRAIRPELILAVDHEGGRVQRFREGFTPIPAMRALGHLYRKDQDQALMLAEQAGWLLAAELVAHDIDLSFAPVLDIDLSVSQVIGDRAFAEDGETVIALAQALIKGMHRAGMVATGKHFPGHGGVVADSHHEIPIDERNWQQINALDIEPFRRLAGVLDAVMPAHVIYPAVDQQPAGFSKPWLQEILRGQLGFDGVIFSDDLSMEGAVVAGSYAERAQAALTAGCDMVLVCNNREGALQVLDYLNQSNHQPSSRLSRLKHARALAGGELAQQSEWREAVAALAQLA